MAKTKPEEDCNESDDILVTGIDEAGRGSMIGPLVVCGITADKKTERELKRIGVKDSKMLSPKRREELYVKIKEVIQSSSSVSAILPVFIPPCKIDSMVSRQEGENETLNTLEAKTMAEIINMVGGDEVYLDALTSRPQKYKEVVIGYLDDTSAKKGVKIIAENNADKKFPIVSAASIIAKVERDRAIDEIKKQCGVDFGVGYPHDERTVQFVDSLIKTQKKLPAYVRKSWMTTQMLQERNWQRRLKDFILRKEKKS